MYDELEIKYVAVIAQDKKSGKVLKVTDDNKTQVFRNVIGVSHRTFDVTERQEAIRWVRERVKVPLEEGPSSEWGHILLNNPEILEERRKAAQNFSLEKSKSRGVKRRGSKYVRIVVR